MNPINSNFTCRLNIGHPQPIYLEISQIPRNGAQCRALPHPTYQSSSYANEWSHNPSIKTSIQQIQNFSLQNEHGHPSSTHTKTCKILSFWEKQPKSSLKWCIKRYSCLSHRRALSSPVWQERNLNTQLKHLKPKRSSISRSFADCACLRWRKTGWLAIHVRKRALA